MLKSSAVTALPLKSNATTIFDSRSFPRAIFHRNAAGAAKFTIIGGYDNDSCQVLDTGSNVYQDGHINYDMYQISTMINIQLNYLN